MSETILVVHCSATRPEQDIGAKVIRDWHLQKGWSDLGYHIVIRRDGFIEYGRPFDRDGAHVKGHNTGTIGVCMVGGLDYDGEPAPEFNGEQLLSLKRVIQALNILFPNIKVMGHRDFPDVHKACPSFDVYHWMTTGVLKP